VISLDAIAAGSAPSLTREDIRSVLCRLAAIQSRIAAHIAEGEGTPPPEDRLLTADEAATRLGVKRQWLYRRSNRLPFVVRLDGKVRYSSHGIDHFIASRSR